MQDGHGDKAEEHLRIARGKYSAWPYVVLGFLMVVFWMAAIPFLAGWLALEPPGRPRYFADRHDADLAGIILTCASGVFGLVAAWLVFRDRWRCVEAFTSRFLSGVTNISLLYAPLIAAGYALVRGFRKLTNSEQSEVQPPFLQPEGAPEGSALLNVISRSLEQAQRAPGNPGYVGPPAFGQPSPSVMAARVIVIVVLLAGVVLYVTRRAWMPNLAVASSTMAPCPGGESYCDLPVAVTPDPAIAAAGATLRLESGELRVSPKEMALSVSGTATWQERSELEVFHVKARLLDDAGKELAVVPLNIQEDFMPPLRSGDSRAFYKRMVVTAVPHRAELNVLERRAVPAALTGDEGTEMAVVMPASARGEFKLSALVRHHESRMLDIKTSGEMLVAIRNDGAGVVRELDVNLVPRGGAGADLGPTHPQTLVYGHMPPMYPGERRVIGLQYYVMGRVLEERLVVTSIK
jgi:hypothetical protein